jgi:Type VI secretion system (T6SS), amidase effector protein 4
MAKKLPHFQELWKNYPGADVDADKVKADIGGGVNGDWITNTCTIRGSHAFNLSGDGKHKIPRTMDIGGGKTLATTYGANKMRYAFRVAEFQPYMEKVYGPPTISKKKPVTGEDFKDKLGLMIFDCRGAWADATGHVDVWDGRKQACKGHAYFSEAQEVFLWETPVFLKVRLKGVNPEDAEHQDDTFTLYSEDRSYEVIQNVSNDVMGGNESLELKFLEMDYSLKYSLEINPGAQGDPYFLFENTDLLQKF